MMPKALDPHSPASILVRGTNWVGDAVMTLPALAALIEACPQAEVTVLAKPWVKPVYETCPGVARVLTLETKGGLQGLKAIWQAARGMRQEGFDWALLFQNALQAALIARLAGIPVRAGYATDGRGWLLSHALPKNPRKKQMHETAYYLHILHGLGLIPVPPPSEGVRPFIRIDPTDYDWAGNYLKEQGIEGRILGLAPGAAFGPAKCWPAQRFAQTARRLLREPFDAALLFGSRGEASYCAQVLRSLEGDRVIDLSGATSLGQALALLARLELFITNDSGLMHAAAALGVSTVAVFGSTNPTTTAPLGPFVELVRKEVDCSPCLKPHCPEGDLKCFTAISPDDVLEACARLLERRSIARLRPVVFLDRDGTINQDSGYLSDPKELELIPGAEKAIARLKRAGYAVVVVTNQSGIARGYYTVKELDAVNREMSRRLALAGAKVEAYYYCPHHAEHAAMDRYALDCECRKPNPGMLIRAARELGLDLGRSFMVGDHHSDLVAGKRAGARSIQVQTGHASRHPDIPDEDRDYLAADLGGAVDWILSQGEAEP